MKSKMITAVILSMTLVISGCSTKWIDVALADIPVLVNLVTSIIGLYNSDPQVGKEVQEYAAEAGSDLQILKALIDEYNSQPSSVRASTKARIAAVLTEISGHFNDILTAAHVHNTNSAQHIAQAVQVAILTVNTISALVTNQKTTARLVTPQELQAYVDDLNSLRLVASR
jgi:hypothetical protein